MGASLGRHRPSSAAGCKAARAGKRAGGRECMRMGSGAGIGSATHWGCRPAATLTAGWGSGQTAHTQEAGDQVSETGGQHLQSAASHWCAFTRDWCGNGWWPHMQRGIPGVRKRAPCWPGRRPPCRASHQGWPVPACPPLRVKGGSSASAALVQCDLGSSALACQHASHCHLTRTQALPAAVRLAGTRLIGGDSIVAAAVRSAEHSDTASQRCSQLPAWSRLGSVPRKRGG